MLPYPPHGAPPPFEPPASYSPSNYPPPASAPYPPASSPPAYNPSTASYSPTASPYPYHNPTSPQPPQQQSASPTSLVGVDLSSLPLQTGTVRWFNPTKGYGFIAPSDGSPHDAFVHQNQLQSDGFRALEREQMVEFRMRIDPFTGKHIALAVTAPGGGKLPAGRRDEDREPPGRGGERERERDRGPPPSFRNNDHFPPAAPSLLSADLDARAPPYDGRNARPAGMSFCVGMVKSFDVGKGFGFLTQLTTASGQTGAGDIFVHQTNVHMEGRRELVEGMMLEYVEGVDDKNGKPLAKNVTGRDGSLITRHDVEAAAAGQQRRPHPPPPHQPHAPHPHAPPSPHRPSPPHSDNHLRSSHVGSRDSEINSSIQPNSSSWHRGTVLTFDPIKKYGFIKPDDGGENMFLHATRCEVPMEELVKGLTLEYQIGVDQKGKECGVNIRRIKGLGGYGPVGRQRSPHRAPAPYGRDGRGMSPGRGRYDEYDGRRDGMNRDRGEYRREYDRRTPPRDYPPPPPPAAYPPPPSSGYPPPPPAQQQPPPAPSAYYDPYRSDPRYAPPPAAPGYHQHPPPASAPAGYDPRYAPPASPYYPPPPATAPQQPVAAPAQTPYYGQHSTPAPPAAPQYYYPPPQPTSASTAAPSQYAYPPHQSAPPPHAAPTAPQPGAAPAAAAPAPANGNSASQPNQMLAHLYSLYSTLSATTASNTQQPSTAPPAAAPAAYHYNAQPTAAHRPY